MVESLLGEVRQVVTEVLKGWKVPALSAFAYYWKESKCCVSVEKLRLRGHASLQSYSLEEQGGDLNSDPLT